MNVGKKVKNKRGIMEDKKDEKIKEIYNFLDGYEKYGMNGLSAAQAVIEYAQYIDNIDYSTAKNILYNFVENMLHPDWN